MDSGIEKLRLHGVVTSCFSIPLSIFNYMMDSFFNYLFKISFVNSTGSTIAPSL